MMYRHLLRIMLMLIACPMSYGQNKIKPFFGTAHPDYFSYNMVVLTPHKVIDTIDHTIYYWRKYRYNPDKESDFLHGRWALEIGRRYSRFYNAGAYRNDLRHTLRAHKDSIVEATMEQFGKEFMEVPRLPVSKGQPLYSEFLCDYSENRLVVTDRIPSPQSGMICYEEAIPEIDWTIRQEKPVEIGGFNCYCATTRFRGREWIAWFTPEIPYHVCLWKLRGLPGLILKLEDSEGDYSFEVIHISRKKRPLWQYRQRKQQITFEKYQRFVRDIHEDATSLLGDCELYRIKEEGGMVRMDQWVVPYNPIERE